MPVRGAVTQSLERATDDREIASSNPSGATSKLGQVRLPPLCQCLLEGRLQAVERSAAFTATRANQCSLNVGLILDHV